jgi:hypothetical protein
MIVKANQGHTGALTCKSHMVPAHTSHADHAYSKIFSVRVHSVGRYTRRMVFVKG